MNSTLENYKKYPGITEAYEVVRTVEVVANRKIYQVEVLKCFSNPPIHYEIRCWELEHIYLQPSYPRTQRPEGPEFEKEPDDMIIRVQWNLPWVHQNNPELALHQALDFLTGVE